MADKVEHRPLTVRNQLPEMVFASEWMKIASVVVDDSDYGYDLDSEDPAMTVGQVIAAGHNRHMHIGQAEATLAATFIVWLGTSVGRCFLERGKMLEDHFRKGVSAGLGGEGGAGFLAAWALHNARSIGLNGGWRTCEFMAGDWKVRGQKEVTAVQLELLDNMARWLGSKHGVRFIERCEAKVFAATQKDEANG